MPAKNALKSYLENGYYHIYNRGVDQNLIFREEQDYLVFESYLRDYLSPAKVPDIEKLMSMKRPYLCKNYFQKITLHAFVLIPNHFHFLLSQKESHTIEFFMRSLLTRYSVYFNRHYSRTGSLFQGVYKGVLIERDEYLWWLSRYIHRNPKQVLTKRQSLDSYPYSSYPTYLGKQNLPWIETKNIKEQIKDYAGFVEDEGQNQSSPEVLRELVLEEDF